MSIGEDIRRELLTIPKFASHIDSESGGRVAQDHVRQDWSRGPYAVYFRAGTSNVDTTDQSPGEQPFKQFFDLECHAEDIAKALDMAGAVRSNWHLYHGPFGQGKVQGVFVQDHDDDYIPRGSSGDEGLHVASLRLEIIGHAGN